MRVDFFDEVCKIGSKFYPEIDKLNLNEKRELNLIYSGLLDSFSVMNFILELEKSFNVQIPASYFEDRRLHRLDQISEIITELQ